MCVHQCSNPGGFISCVKWEPKKKKRKKKAVCHDVDTWLLVYFNGFNTLVTQPYFSCRFFAFLNQIRKVTRRLNL